jgi:Transposase DDE domain group 1
MLQFRGPTITSDAGLLAYRKLDDTLGLTYEDVNDTDRSCRDPAMRRVVGDRAITGSAASAETKWLSRPENLAALADLPGQWIDKAHTRRPPRIVVLDMDSSERPTSVSRKAAPINGHFGCTRYHPLFVFNRPGELYPRVGFIVTNLARPAERVAGRARTSSVSCRRSAPRRPKESGRPSAHGG